MVAILELAVLIISAGPWGTAITVYDLIQAHMSPRWRLGGPLLLSLHPEACKAARQSRPHGLACACDSVPTVVCVLPDPHRRFAVYSTISSACDVAGFDPDPSGTPTALWGALSKPSTALNSAHTPTPDQLYHTPCAVASPLHLRGPSIEARVFTDY